MNHDRSPVVPLARTKIGALLFPATPSFLASEAAPTEGGILCRLMLTQPLSRASFGNARHAVRNEKEGRDCDMHSMLAQAAELHF
jgi:hypothetical protein